MIVESCVVKYIFSILVYFLCTGFAWCVSVASENNKAVQQYNDKKYDEAMSVFTRLQVNQSDNDEIIYNMGNVLYRKGDYQKAASYFSKALNSKNELIRKSAFYNLGNSFVKMNKKGEALKNYAYALSMKQSEEKSFIEIDQKARENIEILMNKKGGEQQDQKQDQKKEEEQKKDKKEQEKQDNKDNKDKDKKKDEQDKQQDQKKDKKEDKQPKPQPKPKFKDVNMTEKQANKILNALTQDEAAILNKAQKQSRKPEDEDPMDW